MDFSGLCSRAPPVPSGPRTSALSRAPGGAGQAVACLPEQGGRGPAGPALPAAAGRSWGRQAPFTSSLTFLGSSQGGAGGRGRPPPPAPWRSNLGPVLRAQLPRRRGGTCAAGRWRPRAAESPTFLAGGYPTEGRHSSNNTPPEQLTLARCSAFGQSWPVTGRPVDRHPRRTLHRTCTRGPGDPSSPGSCLVFWAVLTGLAPLPGGAGPARRRSDRAVGAPSSPLPRLPGPGGSSFLLQAGGLERPVSESGEDTAYLVSARSARVAARPSAAANDNMMTYSTIRELFLCN